MSSESIIFVSETFVVEDCERYDTSVHNTANETVNLPITASTKCKVEFDFTKGASGSGAMVRFGSDSNNFVQVGLMGEAKYGFDISHNGSSVTQQRQSNLSNGTYHTEITYNEGSITCKINNQTFTYTYTQPFTKLIGYYPWTSGSITNMKVKPL